jgi:hypothetical protein
MALRFRQRLHVNACTVGFHDEHLAQIPLRESRHFQPLARVFENFTSVVDDEDPLVSAEFLIFYFALRLERPRRVTLRAGKAGEAAEQ